jgi:hypothetical protein
MEAEMLVLATWNTAKVQEDMSLGMSASGSCAGVWLVACSRFCASLLCV